MSRTFFQKKKPVGLNLTLHTFYFKKKAVILYYIFSGQMKESLVEEFKEFPLRGKIFCSEPLPYYFILYKSPTHQQEEK